MTEVEATETKGAAKTSAAVRNFAYIDFILSKNADKKKHVQTEHHDSDKTEKFANRDHKAATKNDSTAIRSMLFKLAGPILQAPLETGQVHFSIIFKLLERLFSRALKTNNVVCFYYP